MAGLHPLQTPATLHTSAVAVAAAAVNPKTPTVTEASAMESHSTTAGESEGEGEASPPMKCCCGRVDCVFLKHNYAVLDSVEREVHTAARMGQVSLPLLVDSPYPRQSLFHDILMSSLF